MKWHYLKEEIFADFAVFAKICEIKFPRKFSKSGVREIKFPRKFSKSGVRETKFPRNFPKSGIR